MRAGNCGRADRIRIHRCLPDAILAGATARKPEKRVLQSLSWRARSPTGKNTRNRCAEVKETGWRNIKLASTQCELPEAVVAESGWSRRPLALARKVSR